MSLKDYNRKRNFDKTPEPAGNRLHSYRNRFVVQKHEASRLHYDFRLELDGALKSWAVPKGIPFRKGEKRLAVQVEDHPISYVDFEGTIPEGEYGGGTVMVWDQGTFEPLSKDPAKDLAAGKLHFILTGKKLNGEWYLVRMSDRKGWLLIRAGQDLTEVSKKADDTSALTGRSMSAIGKGDKVWHSNRIQDRNVASRIPPHKNKPAFTPEFIEPMKALLVDKPGKGNWLYEIKLDGFRTLACKSGKEAYLFSRNQNDLSEKFPEIRDELKMLKAKEAVLDGEVVALDENGKSSFQLLQGSDSPRDKTSIFYYAFDLLVLNGRNFQREPIEKRKKQLQKLLGESAGRIRYSSFVSGNIETLLTEARRVGLEGLIGKRAHSVYEPGRRSGAWIKLKLHLEQELVIGGYTDGTGTREGFGALLLGHYTERGLYYSGKVGSGFSDELLREIHAKLKKLATPACPFVNLPEKRAGRFGAGLTASAMKKCHWVKPTLVCQVKFGEWTRDGKLRHAVFIALREDKDAREVVREVPK